MSSWDDNKIEILRENWGKMTASTLAEKIGGVTQCSNRKGPSFKSISENKKIFNII